MARIKTSDTRNRRSRTRLIGTRSQRPLAPKLLRTPAITAGRIAASAKQYLVRPMCSTSPVRLCLNEAPKPYAKVDLKPQPNQQQASTQVTAGACRVETFLADLGNFGRASEVIPK